MLQFDCDPGNGVPKANVDDAIALSVLGGWHRQGRINLDLVTTVFGNTPAETGFDAARQLLADLGLATEVQLRVGANRPSSGNPKDWAERLFHQPPPVRDRPAWEISPPTTMIAVGPMTNVAATIAAGSAPKELFLMGGAFGFGDLVDTNFGVDPLAAAQVLRSGVPVTLVPLDVTRTTLLRPEDWAQIKKKLSDSPTGFGPGFADRMVSWLEPWMDYSVATRGINGMWLHDVVAVAAWLSPEICTFDWEPVAIADATDRHPGKVRIDPTGREIRVVKSVDNVALLDFITRALVD